jgi:hypothetical protein
MPLARYTPEDFAVQHGAQLQTPEDLTLSWAELIWAAITVGRAELLHVFRHADYSLFEISYRVAILFANLCELDTGRIIRSDAYIGLDPSEKSAISYFLGMTLTKAAVHRLCAVPWLMHMDVYRADLGATFSSGRARPDLVGKDSQGRWVVVESKGRSNGFDGRALASAREQAQKLTDISGEKPYMAIGTLVHFDAGVLQIHLRDPESDTEEKVSIPLTSERFFEGYYRPFRNWLQRNTAARSVIIQGRTFFEVPLGHLDLAIGLEAALLKDSPISERANSAAEFARDFAREPQERVFVGADGILVRTGSLWDSNNMRQQPQERARE